MAVGTDIGNTYRGRQGTGFATVIDYNPQIDLSLAEMKFQKEQAAAKEKADKEAKLMNAYSQMGKIKPDNWYAHDEQMTGMTEGLLDLGASVLSKGEDPFTSASPAAQGFQKLLIENTRYTEYSKQFQKEFAEEQKAYKNGEEIENWDEIVLYRTNPDLIGLVNGDYGKAPKPIFKKPEVSTFKAMNEYWDKWKGNNKERIPTMDDAKMMAEEILSDPTVSQGFSSTGGKLKQRYDNLPDEQKEALTARGGRLDGYQQYVAEQMYALSNPNFNTEESILKLASEIKTSIWEVEKGDKTVKSRYSKHSNKDLEGYIDSNLQDGAVQREVAAGKYGNPSKDIEYNRKAAVKHYLPTLKKNISTEHSEKYDESGGGAKKEFKASEKDWLNDFRGLNGKAAQDNARERLRGITLPDGEMKLTLTFGDEEGVDRAPINVKEATDEQLLRYLYESDKLRGVPYKSTAGKTADDIGTPTNKTADDL